MEAIKGYAGTLTAAGVTVAWVGTWEATVEREEKTVGPFIGDGGNEYAYYSVKRLKGSIEAVVPKNKDTGQTILISGAMNDTTINLVLTTTDGYTITVPSGLINTFTIAQDGAETVTATFDFRSNGSFSVV